MLLPTPPLGPGHLGFGCIVGRKGDMERCVVELYETVHRICELRSCRKKSIGISRETEIVIVTSRGQGKRRKVREDLPHECMPRGQGRKQHNTITTTWGGTKRPLPETESDRKRKSKYRQKPETKRYPASRKAGFALSRGTPCFRKAGYTLRNASHGAGQKTIQNDHYNAWGAQSCRSLRHETLLSEKQGLG